MDRENTTPRDPYYQRIDAVAQMVEEQKQAFAEKTEADEKRFTHLTDLVERQAELTAKNQEQLGSLISETRDLLQLYRDFQGIGRIGSGLQRLALWLLKWPLIGAGLYSAAMAVVEYGKTHAWW